MANKKTFLKCFAEVKVVILCLYIGAVNANEISKGQERAKGSQQPGSLSLLMPKVLPSADVAIYQKIFSIQKAGQWKKANALIAKLTDKLLLGHVLAQRYLHPTKYRSRYKELRDWMAVYADHPDARQIYKLALRRKPKSWRNPSPPKHIKSYRKEIRTNLGKVKGRSLNRSDRSKVSSLKRQIRRALRRGHTLTAKKILQSPNLKRLFSETEYDEASAKLGQAYFNDGRDDYALKWAGEAAKRSGHIIPGAHWTSGLASWRLKMTHQSAHHFKKAAHFSTSTEWLHSAASFWAARAYLVGRKPEKVNFFLKMAAAKPQTFYGLLAHKVLGLSLPFSWTSKPLNKALLETVIRHPRGKRSIALIQANEIRRAGRELRNLSRREDDKLSRGLLTLADQLGMAEFAVRLNTRLFPHGGGLDNAAYPIPTWKPFDGFLIDRALIYALIRQESRFNPKAKSWAGARGLMQIMPATARSVARIARLRYRNKRKLFDPEFNLTLGQRYIQMLLENPYIKYDLFFTMTAWNGGPGNLRNWRRKTNDLNDPLFFIESLPSRETRNFIEHTLANLWIYRHRFGQPQPSLKAIAAGEWPVYIPLDKNNDEQLATRNGKQNRN